MTIGKTIRPMSIKSEISLALRDALIRNSN